MNAGAYGGEIKDVIEAVSVLTKDIERKVFTAEELQLSYRHSILMEEGGYVTDVTLKLSQGNADEIKARIDDIREQRVTKQPLNFPSAGSTFKRPEGYFAGKLIDDAGLRGYTVGGAQVSEKHCGFVVNKDNASCKDVLELMHNVDAKVFDKFGVHLTPEVRIIGRNIN
jgi:UDP-N-acetylmuramate dehydrogenase